jgi:DNA-binding beta-propeller fold protein YncE
LDRVSGAITATIKVGNKARTLTITPQGDYLFVCNYDDATVSCVDLETQSEVFNIDAFRPIGLAVSAEGDRLFVCQYAPPQVAVYQIVRE